MRKRAKKEFCAAAALLFAFVVWTLLLRIVDVGAIGPRGSAVGFATWNGAFHKLTGTNMTLYTVTDWLGLVPIGVAFSFAVLGLAQWIRRKNFLRVDKSILALGGFYLLVMGVYALFELVVVNRRPVLIDGYLEASYPSSTTMLVLCAMPTAMMQLHARIRKKLLQYGTNFILLGFTAFMVVGRLLSGVHWLSDILGGGLLSAGLVMAYHATLCLLRTEKSPETGQVSGDFSKIQRI